MTDVRRLTEQATLIQQTMLARLKDDPLANFKAHRKQQDFIDSILKNRTRQAWAFCGNRCLTPWTPFETGSSTRLIAEVIGERSFDVQSWDGDSLCTRKASNVFLKGIEPAFRFHLDSGKVFEATCKHRVLTPSGWFSLGSLLSMQDDLRWMETSEDYPRGYGVDDRQYGQSHLSASDTDLIELPPGADVRPRHRQDGAHWDVREPTPERIHACLDSFRLSTPDDGNLLSALCDLWTNLGIAADGQRRNSDTQDVPPSGSASSPRQSVCQVSQRQYHALSCPILLMGGEKLIGYQKIGLRPIVDFEVEGTHCYVAEGVIHHNSGKTQAAAYIGSHMARYGAPKKETVPHFIKDSGGTTIEVSDYATSGWVISQDFNASRDAVQPKYFDNGFAPPGATPPFIPEREIKEMPEGWNIQNQILRLKNGSIIGFKSSDSKVIKFASAEKDWIHFDEEPRKDLYEECVIRIGSRPLRIFGSCTLLPPEGQIGGVTWMFSDFIQPWQEGKKPDMELFTWSIYDNPHIGREEIRLLESIYPEGSAMREIRLEGKWIPGIGGARCYPLFSRERHVSPQPEWNPRLPLCWMLDFNVAPFITIVGQQDGKLFRFYDELVLEEGVHDEMCQLFYERFSTHRGEIWIYGDATGKRRSAHTGQSDYTMILSGMRKYQRSLKLRVPDSNPAVPDRINAMNRQFRDEFGACNVSVDPKCVELIADFEQVLRDSRGGIKKSHKANDPYYRRTHASDCAGYWIAHEAPVTPAVEKRRKSMGMPVPPPSYGFAKRS